MVIPTLTEAEIAAQVAPYRVESAIKDTPTDDAEAAFDPSPEHLAKRLQTVTVGGLRLSLVPQKTRGQAVVAHLRLNLGDERSIGAHTTTAWFVAGMLQRSGTTRRTRLEFQDELNRLKSDLTFAAQGGTVTIQCSTTRANLLPVLELLAEKLRTPQFTEEDWTAIEGERLGRLDESLSSPRMAAQAALLQHLNSYPKNHQRYYVTPEEYRTALLQVKLSDLVSFYRKFYGASNAELAVVGDFDREALLRQAPGLFAGWESKIPHREAPYLYENRPARRKTVELSSDDSAFLSLGMNLRVRDTDPDYAPLLLTSFMLGDGSFLSARLPSLIREKTGLSYEVSSSITAQGLGRDARFIINISCHKDNVARIEKLVRQELAQISRQGFTAEEIETARTGYMETQRVAYAESLRLANKLNLYAHYGRGLDWDANLEARIAKLTPEQIHAAFRRHIDLSRLSVAVAGDFAKD